MKYHISIASFLLAIAVLMGAFGAHALESTLTSKRMDTWETAVFYHAWNALGVIVIGIFSKIYAITCTRAANGLLLGIIVFSGSLYTLCLTNIGWFGAITPLGGICLIGAWIDFGINLLKKDRIDLVDP